MSHGLPATEEVLDFEANVGGWCSAHKESAHGLGVYLSLEPGEGCSAVAAEFRNNAWIFEGDRDVDEGSDASPIWGTGYPRAFFLDRALVPAGMAGSDEFYFIAASGEVYIWVMPSDQLLLKAGSGRTLLETLGLIRDKGQGWFDVHICGDVGELLARTLAVPYYDPASDHLFKWWVDGDVQVRVLPSHAPCITGTHLACRSEADFLKAVRSVREAYGGKRVRIWKNANVIYDEGGIDCLLRSSIDCEILSGPGPRHGGNQYDVSLCDPKTWR